VPPDALGVWALPDAVAEAVQAPGCLLVVVKEASGEFWTRREDGRLGDQLDGMIVDVSQDLFRRLRGVVDQSQLQQRVVTIVGCGSLGSGIACLLVVAGLGSIILIDRDRLETHNVIRHLCGVSDLGRFKVHAVADRLRDKNPGVVVEAWPVDAAEKHDVLVDAIRRSDLVIAATDSPQAQLMINADAIAAGKPALYPGAYNFAFGGESIRVIPGRTACLRCVYDATAELFQRSEPGANGQTAAYDADRGHPGMWIDVGFIAHLAARMAVETLLGQHDPAVNLTGHYLLWGNRRMWAFDRPLHHRWLKVRRNPTCPACGGEAAMEAQLASHGLDRPSAEAEGRRVLETVHPDCDGLVSGLIGWRRSPFV
jgi:molybdopterin/thiamine biosynthesis adenylyltransferase